MRLREIEVRIVKLEAIHRTNPFAGMSEEELEREIALRMDRVAARYGKDYACTAEALRANPEPVSQRAADGFEWFIERNCRKQEYREWRDGVLTERA